MPKGVSPQDFVFELLKNGASVDMNVDGSVSPVEFKYTNSTGGDVLVQRVNASILDAGIAPGDFGGLTALSTGLLIEVIDGDDATIQNFGTDDLPIKKNADWALLAGVDAVVQPAVGDDQLPIRWTISKASGKPLILRADHAFKVTISDDLTGLTAFNMMLQGVLAKAL